MGRKLYIVDGYNVIAAMTPGVMGNGSSSAASSVDRRPLGQGELETQRDRLIEQMAEVAGREGVDVKIVFDGRREVSAPGSSAPGVHVMFSEKPHGADQVIERLTRDVEAYEHVYVVTGDYLQQRVTFGGKVLRMSPREIIEIINGDSADDDTPRAPQSGQRESKGYRLAESVDVDVAKRLKKMTRPD